MGPRSTHGRKLRWPARFMTVVFGVSSIMAGVGPAQAGSTNREFRPANQPHERKLTPEEMRHIRGAQGQQGGHTLSVSPDGGEAYSWEGSNGGTNTANGNKLTAIPIVSWTARGGMPVAVTLNHNSEGSHNSELGPKWCHSYDISLQVMHGDFDMAVVSWGDEQAIAFVDNMNGTFTAPTGIHDTLVSHGSPITSYDLTTKHGIVYNFTYVGGGWYCTSITDRNGNVISITRNGSGYVTEVEDPTGRSVTFGYTSNKITTITDPLSRVWTLTYSSGKLVSIDWPNVNSTSYDIDFAYDGSNRITTLTDLRGNDWTFSYNSDGSLAWEKDPLNNQTSYSYASGETTITDPNSHTTKHLYSSGRLTGVKDALNNQESYTYDGDNNLATKTDRRSKVWTYDFDGSGNCISIIDPLSKETEMTYNGFSQVLKVVTPLGNQVVNTYDGDGNLTETQQLDDMDVEITTVSYDYDANGLLETKTDANSHATEYTYDTDGNLETVTTANGRETSYTYNDIGDCESKTDPLSRTTTYALDEWCRVEGKNFPAGTDPTFTYDANSNLIGWTDDAGTWERTYDTANRITAEKLNTVTRFSYSYDASGKKGLLSTVTDASSRTVTYAYTNRNELYTVVDSAGTTAYSYNNNGDVTGITNPNTTTVTSTYTDRGELDVLTNKNSGNTTLSSYDYGYDDDGRRTSVTENDSSTVSWGYDAANRLTSETRTGTNSYSKTYTVDGVGNRTAQNVGGTSTTFTLNNDDELTATSGGFSNSYSYNSNGEQTGRTLSGTSHTLSYDYEGQLTSIVVGGNTTSFAYDALGRRFTRASGGTTTQFLSSGSEVWLESVGGSVTATYTYGLGLIRRGSEYPLYDGIGTARKTANGSQTVTHTLNTDSFGNSVGSTGSTSSSYGFAGALGYRADGDAGLSHVGARYYDAQVGRFITRDTYLDQKPYLYCEHDPAGNVDPSGHAIGKGWRKVVRIIGAGFNLWNLRIPEDSPSPEEEAGRKPSGRVQKPSGQGGKGNGDDDGSGTIGDFIIKVPKTPLSIPIIFIAPPEFFKDPVGFLKWGGRPPVGA